MKKMRKCADGGKAGSEYGKPTFARAVMARVGIGDGYGNAAKAKPEEKRMNVSNAPTAMKDVMAKRKAALNEYADGGKVCGSGKPKRSGKHC